MSDQARLSWALAVSLLLHLTLLALLPILRKFELPAIAPPSIDVDLAQLPLPKPAAPAPKVVAPPPDAVADAKPSQPNLLPERQIVTPPDAGEERPPEKTRFLSDRDNTVAQEMIRRGQPAPGEAGPENKPPAQRAEARAAAPPKAPAPPRQPREPSANEQVASLPKLDQLLPRAGDLVRQGAVVAQPQEQAAPTPSHRNLLASGGGGAFSSRPGINDYIPTIREGDITLLNTKAELFAPFVRRVAGRIFQHLAMGLDRARFASGVGSGREFAVVEAIMSKKGRLVSARLVQKDSNSGLAAHRELLAVTQPDIFFDENPPPGAEASDGNIHFMLLVDIMVQGMTDPRTGRSSAGYYGMAGVGLDAEPKKE
ncbi:MAG TPA: hypothetical protein VMW17_12145 [Candidatus Binatia bacterium]|nr:hypothetical protein [Candidatus Binatia bacterium]